MGEPKSRKHTVSVRERVGARADTPCLTLTRYVHPRESHTVEGWIWPVTIVGAELVLADLTCGLAMHRDVATGCSAQLETLHASYPPGCYSADRIIHQMTLYPPIVLLCLLISRTHTGRLLLLRCGVLVASHFLLQCTTSRGCVGVLL